MTTFLHNIAHGLVHESTKQKSALVGGAMAGAGIVISGALLLGAAVTLPAVGVGAAIGAVANAIDKKKL